MSLSEVRKFNGRPRTWKWEQSAGMSFRVSQEGQMKEHGLLIGMELQFGHAVAVGSGGGVVVKLEDSMCGCWCGRMSRRRGWSRRRCDVSIDSREGTWGSNRNYLSRIKLNLLTT